MKTYTLQATVTVSAYTNVLADSAERAIEIAKNREVLIGGACGDADPNESWVIEDADGEAQDIRFDDDMRN